MKGRKWPYAVIIFVVLIALAATGLILTSSTSSISSILKKQQRVELPEQIVVGLTEFVLVEGGTFKNKKSNYYGKSVKMPDFYIGKYEVTQEEWIDVMESNPSKFKGDDLPVEMVTWYDCVEYCNKRSIKEGLEPYYNIDRNKKDPNKVNDLNDIKWTVTIDVDANGYRLPTEAQWEYAAGGGRMSRSYKYSGSDNIEEVAWYWKNSGDKYLTGFWNWPAVEDNNNKTKSIGLKKPNELGLYDMSGNVREWCWDWHESSGAEDPQGWACRGGGWLGADYCCSSSFRGKFEANGIGPDTGFRVCRSKLTQAVVADGNESPKYIMKPAIDETVFDPNNAGLAYKILKGDKYVVVVNGQEGPKYDDIMPDSIVLSPDGTHFAYAAKKGNGCLVVVDGNEEPVYDGISISSPTFSPDGYNLAYGAVKDDQWFVVLNGQPMQYNCNDIGPILFSPDGRHLIHTIQKDNRWFLVIDGEIKSDYEHIYELNPTYDAVEYTADTDGWVFRCRQNYPSTDGGKLIQEKIYRYDP